MTYKKYKFKNNDVVEVIIDSVPGSNAEPFTIKYNVAVTKKLKVLDDINKMGTTIVMTTHNRDIVNEMKKRVIVLNEGKIVQDYERGKYYEVV